MPAPVNIQVTTDMQRTMDQLCRVYTSNGLGWLEFVVSYRNFYNGIHTFLNGLNLRYHLNESRRLEIQCGLGIECMENGFELTPHECTELIVEDPALRSQVDEVSQLLLYYTVLGFALSPLIESFQSAYMGSSVLQRVWRFFGGHHLQSGLVSLETQLHDYLYQNPNFKIHKIMIDYFRDHSYKMNDPQSAKEMLDYLFDHGIQEQLTNITKSSSGYNFAELSQKLAYEIKRQQPGFVEENFQMPAVILVLMQLSLEEQPVGAIQEGPPIAEERALGEGLRRE